MARNEHAPEAAQPASPLTVLLVADDPHVLTLLRMALALEFGCSVLTAQSAWSVQEVAQRSRPALLILDETLLKEQIHAVAARLHRIAGLEQLPTLVINAVGPFNDEREGYPVRFLEPSWKVAALYAAVRTLLGQTL
jgi:response regulator RpfG family c-di-GMP phosphodiesterase